MSKPCIFIIIYFIIFTIFKMGLILEMAMNVDVWRGSFGSTSQCLPNQPKRTRLKKLLALSQTGSSRSRSVAQNHYRNANSQWQLGIFFVHTIQPAILLAYRFTIIGSFLHYTLMILELDPTSFLKQDHPANRANPYLQTARTSGSPTHDETLTLQEKGENKR
jgi:hypothetical protein